MGREVPNEGYYKHLILNRKTLKCNIIYVCVRAQIGTNIYT